jgi:uncharacterized protein YdaL
LWIKYKDNICGGILFNIRNRTENMNLQISEEIYNQTSIFIEDMCLMMSNKLLYQLGMALLNRPMHDAFYQHEKSYDLNTLKK